MEFLLLLEVAMRLRRRVDGRALRLSEFFVLALEISLRRQPALSGRLLLNGSLLVQRDIARRARCGCHARWR
jgi:hypothetical protein